MKIGSLVETVGDFEEIRKTWGLPYPKKGDPLTISNITPHPNASMRKKGIVLLHFEELPTLVGICDKTINNEPNFVELLLPDDIVEALSKPIKQSLDEKIKTWEELRKQKREERSKRIR